jgi:hypothetical protein
MPTKLAPLLAALIVAGLVGPASAEPYVFGQQPPQDQGQTPPEPHDCVVHNSDFTPNATFVIELTNTCEQRYRCTLRAYITNAAGPTRDEVVLTLEPASSGPGARKVHIIKLKESYGEAQSSQSCEAL